MSEKSSDPFGQLVAGLFLTGIALGLFEKCSHAASRHSDDIKRILCVGVAVVIVAIIMSARSRK